MSKPRTRTAAARDDHRLGRADWIEGALALLAEDTVDALRIDTLARRLKVTKGSFYWHFDTRESLLQAVLETWRARMAADVAAFLGLTTGTPAARLNSLLRIAIAPRPDVPGGPLELSLRDWGRRDPKVQKVLHEIDAERIAFLTGLYAEAGLGRQEAEEKALAHMAFTIGARMLLVGNDRVALERRWKVGKALLVPAPKPHER